MGVESWTRLCWVWSRLPHLSHIHCWLLSAPCFLLSLQTSGLPPTLGAVSTKHRPEHRVIVRLPKTILTVRLSVFIAVYIRAHVTVSLPLKWSQYQSIFPIIVNGYMFGSKKWHLTACRPKIETSKSKGICNGWLKKALNLKFNECLNKQVL